MPLPGCFVNSGSGNRPEGSAAEPLPRTFSFVSVISGTAREFEGFQLPVGPGRVLGSEPLRIPVGSGNRLGYRNL
jgi:hypothetical protein